MRLADIFIYYPVYNVANFAEPRSAGRNIDAIIIATSLRTQPPVAAGGSGGWKAKWAEVQRRRKEDERPSCHASANFLLVFVAHSIMLLHTPVPVIQGRPRPAKCIITLNRYCRCTYVGHHTRWHIQISVSKPEYLRPYRPMPTDWQKSYVVTALIDGAGAYCLESFYCHYFVI